MRIIIDTDPKLSKFIESLSDIARKQVPYAASRAINESLLFAQGQVRRELPKHFKIRSNWVAKGIRVSFANKRTLTGTIFTKDEFMARQELGGEKRPQGKDQAVPFAVRGSDGMQKTLRSRWPSHLLEKPGVFKIRTKHNVHLILKRMGRRKQNVVVLYAMLDRAVKVKQKWQFRKTVEQIVNRVFPVVFKSELAKAISTAKR